MGNAFLSVQDILNKYLSADKYICHAGHSGLQKPVSWVSSVDLNHMNSSHDGVFFVSSGLPFADNHNYIFNLEKLRDIIESGAVGLAIDTSLHYHVIEPALIDLADEHNFPLIEITEPLDLTEFIRVVDTKLLNFEAAKHAESSFTINVWINDWLNGVITEKEIEEKIKSTGIILPCTCCVILRILPKWRSPDPSGNNQKYLSEVSLPLSVCLSIKNYYESRGFSVLTSYEDSFLNFVFFSYHKGNVRTFVETLRDSTISLKQQNDNIIDLENSYYAFGKAVTSLSDISISFRTSTEMLQDQTIMSDGIAVYDLLYFKRLLINLDKNGALRTLMYESLGPLTQYENRDLLLTLRTYYQNNCNKSLTASALFISRQTLYLRLERIKEMLGDDFDIGEKRLALELSVNAFYEQRKQ